MPINAELSSRADSFTSTVNSINGFEVDVDCVDDSIDDLCATGALNTFKEITSPGFLLFK